MSIVYRQFPRHQFCRLLNLLELSQPQAPRLLLQLLMTPMLLLRQLMIPVMLPSPATNGSADRESPRPTGIPVDESPPLMRTCRAERGGLEQAAGSESVLPLKLTVYLATGVAA